MIPFTRPLILAVEGGGEGKRKKKKEVAEVNRREGLEGKEKIREEIILEEKRRNGRKNLMTRKKKEGIKQ